MKRNGQTYRHFSDLVKERQFTQSAVDKRESVWKDRGKKRESEKEESRKCAKRSDYPCRRKQEYLQRIHLQAIADPVGGLVCCQMALKFNPEFTRLNSSR